MYNKQLDTFLLVAEKKSFSKAAEALYLTPSAVIQQINNLEKDLHVRLFDRTRHGISLTEAGKLLAAEAGPFIAAGHAIRQKLLAASMKQTRICVGTSVLQKIRFLYEIWMLFSDLHRNYHVDIISIDAAADQMGDAELIESLYDYAPWQKTWKFLKLCDAAVGCAVPKNHALASHTFIRYQDLEKYSLVLMNHDFSDIHQKLYKNILSHGINVIETSHFDTSTLWKCACSQYILQAPLCWHDILPDMVLVPCEWGFTLPYGFFYQENCSVPVREFIDFTYRLYHGESKKQIKQFC